MSEPDRAGPLRELGERLARARRKERRPSSGGSEEDSGFPQGAFALALRVAVELVAALLVAGIIGWTIDRWLGTRPWGLVVFFFVGAAAGMLNVYRAVAGSEMMSGDDAATRKDASADVVNNRTGEDGD
jgi:ATP synthase protein I